MAKRPLTPTPEAAEAIRALGEAIRLGRKANGWTASGFAAHLGVSGKTLSSIEAGAPGTAIASVFDAAVAVGVPLGPERPEEGPSGRRSKRRRRKADSHAVPLF